MVRFTTLETCYRHHKIPFCDWGPITRWIVDEERPPERVVRRMLLPNYSRCLLEIADEIVAQAEEQTADLLCV